MLPPLLCGIIHVCGFESRLPLSQLRRYLLKSTAMFIEASKLRIIGLLLMFYQPGIFCTHRREEVPAVGKMCGGEDLETLLTSVKYHMGGWVGVRTSFV